MTKKLQPGDRREPRAHPINGHPWRDALWRAICQYQDEGQQVKAGQALHRIARNVVRLAIDSDFEAIKEIANRLDGKPRESVSIQSDNQGAMALLLLSADDLRARLRGISTEPKIIEHDNTIVAEGAECLVSSEVPQQSDQ